MKKILILFGGNSYEHKVSCESVKTIVSNIDTSIYDVTLTAIDLDNSWYLISKYSDILSEDDWHNCKREPIVNITKFVSSFDKVFPVMHGSPVEDGTIQGLLNLTNTKLVGVNLESSVICYNKRITKILCNHYQIPIIPYIEISNLKEVKHIDIDYPVIVKPARCGSSIGINLANNIIELNKAIKEAFSYDSQVIVEKFIKAREFECAIFKNKQIHISTVGEIKANNSFYDYDSKYQSMSKITYPANIDKNLLKEIQKISMKLFNILNIQTFARFDFLYDYHNHILYFNEVNTMPGFTFKSMFPMLFNYDKISTKKLITHLIEGSN